MKFPAGLLFLALCFAACDKNPEESVLTPDERAALAATPKPTPKPGDWMWNKNRGNPLEERPKR